MNGAKSEIIKKSSDILSTNIAYSKFAYTYLVKL